MMNPVACKWSNNMSTRLLALPRFSVVPKNMFLEFPRFSSTTKKDPPKYSRASYSTKYWHQSLLFLSAWLNLKLNFIEKPIIFWSSKSTVYVFTFQFCRTWQVLFQCQKGFSPKKLKNQPHYQEHYLLLSDWNLTRQLSLHTKSSVLLHALT